MKFVIIFSIFLICSVSSAPLDNSNNAQILRFQNDNSGDGYNFLYETSDGVTRQETGSLKNPGSEQEAFVIRGSVSWVADDGQTYTLNYIADENGYQPQGDHIPRA